ncbi:MAG: hypothetical protein ACTSWY_09010 [Promethearchaeota archaeon]
MVNVSFPNTLGNARIAFKGFLESIPGINVILPPPVSEETLEIGTKNSPDYVCLPFRSSLGDFIRTLEHNSVDIFLTVMDCGPCRYGLFYPIQEQILKDLGYDVSIITLQRDDFLKFKWLKTIERLSDEKSKFWRLLNIAEAGQNFLRKAKLVEDMEIMASYFRCRELSKGKTTEVFANLIKILTDISTLEEFNKFRIDMMSYFRAIQIDRDAKPLRVGISGEVHTIMEPTLNLDIIRRLGEAGIEVHYTQSLLDFLLHKLHLNFRRKEPENLGRSHLKLDIGGNALWSIGEYEMAIRKGFDGFIYVYPLMCMPGATARSIIEGIESSRIPVIFVSPNGRIGKIEIKNLETKIIEFRNLMERRWSKGMVTLPEKKYADEKSLINRVSIKSGPLLGEPFGALESFWNVFKDVNPVDFIKELIPDFSESGSESKSS